MRFDEGINSCEDNSFIGDYFEGLLGTVKRGIVVKSSESIWDLISAFF